MVLLLSIACIEQSFSELDDVDNPGRDSGYEWADDSGQPGDSDDADPSWDAGVTGRICDPSGGDWVLGALVWTMFDSDGDGTADSRREDTTDADGRFTLSNLPGGDYTVYVEKGSFTAEFDVTLTGGMYEIPDPECLLPPDILVVTGAYDSIEDVLDRMGVEYDLINGVSGQQHTNFLKDSAQMAAYDIIFLNCGMSDGWVNSKDVIGANIKQYALDGGSVYTSDWSYYAFEVAFPDAVDFYGDDKTSGAAYVGSAATVNAAVVDATMQGVLGKSTAKINYDLDAWAVMESANSDVDVLLTGDAPFFDWNTWASGTVKNSPLAVEIHPGGGNMIYTSFHNERQTTSDMDLMLEEIILSL
jgi:hypothetical protein